MVGFFSVFDLLIGRLTSIHLVPTESQAAALEKAKLRKEEDMGRK